MQQTKGFAVSALVVGIVAFLVGWIPVLGLFASAAAIGLGIWALVKKQSTGMSVTGIVLGALAFLTSVITTIALMIGVANPDVPSNVISDKREPVESVPEKTEKPQEQHDVKPSGIEIPDLEGQAADEADDALEDLGFETEFDAGDDTVIMRSNWIVTGTTPAAGERAKKGSTVTIRVEKPKREPAEVEQTTLGLTGSTAWTMCTQSGKTMFPYGFRIHMTGVMADTPQEDVWFLKSTITTENEFGNKRKDQVMECYVTGTDDAPELEDFLVY